jgi:hypothetical protein
VRFAALLWATTPRVIEAVGHLIYALRDRPMTAFVAFLIFSIIVYLPLHLIVGDAAWLVPYALPSPIQTSRILLYAGYFFVGVGIGAVGLRTSLLVEDGELAQRWAVWLTFAIAFYGAILFLVYAHHNWVADFESPPMLCYTPAALSPLRRQNPREEPGALAAHARMAYGLAFAMFSAAMAFTVPAVSLRFARSSVWLLDVMLPSAYGIYLLHFIPLIWFQYLVYDPYFPAFVKCAIVFTATLSMSWARAVRGRRCLAAEAGAATIWR